MLHHKRVVLIPVDRERSGFRLKQNRISHVYPIWIPWLLPSKVVSRLALFRVTPDTEAEMLTLTFFEKSVYTREQSPLKAPHLC